MSLSAARDEIRELVGAGKSEPVGHELLREAESQIYANPRSALILAMTAAEVGVKECISDLVPDAQWLVQETPTPPLIRIVEQYLPRLDQQARATINGKVLPPPKMTITQLKKGITIRNRLIHVGHDVPAPEALTDIIQAVNDLLWLLDYYRGSAWARDYLHY